MRRVHVVSTSRADYGIYRPVLRAAAATPSLLVELVVTGSHLSVAHGETVRQIELDGWTVASRIPLPDDDDSPGGATRATAAALIGFASSFESNRPDLLVVLGDRYEMHAAALAALPQRIPVAHIHGGELTQGAFDDALRHGITKLSHLHFASTEESARRIVQLGEESWRVTVSGAPMLDELCRLEPLPKDELSERFGIPFEPAPIVVSHHPATLGDAELEGSELVAALASVRRPLLVTAPNADPGGKALRRRLDDLVASRDDAVLVPSIGSSYGSVLARAAAMVGNSSSGLIEAPSLGLPVVNIGPRQDGRLRAGNVIDVPAERTAIARAIERALDPSFRSGLVGAKNPYGDGHASERIAARLADVEIDDALLVKRFNDEPWTVEP